MILRRPAVAGRFYPADSGQLKEDVNARMRKAHRGEAAERPIWGVMLPHAGHIFCGDVIAKTLDGVALLPRLVVLCPNHTGYGKPLGVWPAGAWLTPLGQIDVDEKLVSEIIASGGGFEADAASHMGEHSIEVLLPFLQEKMKNFTIAPICVGIRSEPLLRRAGEALASVLKKPENANVGIVVSSDMNHYESHNKTLAKDQMALDCALACNPEGLLEVTDRENISMCGAAPMSLAMFTAKALGKLSVSLAGHTTSGPVSGDYGHTVGYAGLRMARE